MEGWMIGLAISILAAVGTYAVTKYRVSRNEEEFKAHNIEDGIIHTKQDEKMGAGFKKLDEALSRITVLESTTAKYLDLETAENKFVTRIELHLIVDKLSLTAKHSDSTISEVKQDVRELKGKLEDFMNAIHREIVDRKAI